MIRKIENNQKMERSVVALSMSRMVYEISPLMQSQKSQLEEWGRFPKELKICCEKNIESLGYKISWKLFWLCIQPFQHSNLLACDKQTDEQTESL